MNKVQSMFTCVMILSLVLPAGAYAKEHTITVKGTVGASKYKMASKDELGNVFGLVDLDGQPFTLVFTIDDSKGLSAFSPQEKPISSITKIKRLDNPIKAELTINGHKVFFGALQINPATDQGSLVDGQIRAIRNTNQFYRKIYVSEQKRTMSNFEHTGRGVYVDIFYTLDNCDMSYDWRVPTPCPIGESTKGTFHYEHSSGGAVPPKYDQKVRGNLKITSIEQSP